MTVMAAMAGREWPVLNSKHIYKRMISYIFREMTEMDNLPWIEKYRPKSLEDILSHQDIIHTTSQFIDEDRLPHLLLYGPPGTGKTSTILACCRKMYGDNYKPMVIHLNASDERGIEVVRQRIKDFANTLNFLQKKQAKMVILDEADSMTEDAQLALREIIVNHSQNTRFCLICNNINRITTSLKSRLTRFRFAPLSLQDIREKVEHIIEMEKIRFTSEGIMAIYHISQGDLRRFLNLLQSTATTHNIISKESVYLSACKPNPDTIKDLIQQLLRLEFAEGYRLINDYVNGNGIALIDIIMELPEIIVGFNLDSALMSRLLASISQLEYNLSATSTDELYIAAFVGCFFPLREV